MQHSIEDLIRRLNVMHEKAIMIHRLRNEFSEQAEKSYDKEKCKELLADIQGMAYLIAGDREGDDIKTEMEYKK